MLRTIFIKLSESGGLRKLAEDSAFGNRLSSRFVAGTTVEQAIAAAAELNQAGISFSLDYLGENVSSEEEARENEAFYGRLLEEIVSKGLEGNASMKLTQMGLDSSTELATEITANLVGRAAALGTFLRVDMEGSDYTQRTLDIVREVHRREGNAGHVGAVIQSYLYRSEADVRDLCERGIRIRLCKGAYKEPAEIAWQDKADVDASFVRLMKIMLDSGIYHGIATHDERMIDATIARATERSIDPAAFEFQMLYGIRRDLQEKLVRDGWNMRVYVPFGGEWYPYFMRRLAERPANVIFVLKNLFR